MSGAKTLVDKQVKLGKLHSAKPGASEQYPTIDIFADELMTKLLPVDPHSHTAAQADEDRGSKASRHLANDLG